MDDHVVKHEVFIEKVMDLNFSPDAQGNSPQGILDFLRQWLIGHIYSTDQKLGAYLCMCVR
jgi:hemerythrin